jgi:glycosyltransferase involved in cell wall biosynthesis
MAEKIFPGNVGLQQRVLPMYRAAFLNHLAKACLGGLSVFAGKPRQDESIVTVHEIPNAEFVAARNIHLLRGKFYLCLQLGLLSWLKRWDPSALILEANLRYPINRLAINWMHQRGRPVIGWGLGTRKSRGLFSGIQNQMRLGFLSSFDALITYSTQGAEQCIASGVSEEKVFVAVNSLSPALDKMPERKPFEGRKLCVLHVGRLQERKRLDLLIRACAAQEMRPELWIVGDGPEQENLKALASEIYPNTKFSGFLHGTDLEQCFKSADLFVLPGTGGLAVQEAMVYGLPILVGEADGTQLDLVSPENGWHIIPGDLDDLVKTMRLAFSDTARLAKMGEASFRVVRDRANIEIMAEVFVQALEFASRGVM